MSSNTSFNPPRIVPFTDLEILQKRYNELEQRHLNLLEDFLQNNSRLIELAKENGKLWERILNRDYGPNKKQQPHNASRSKAHVIPFTMIVQA